MKKTGTLFWITGISGAGKTTLAQLLYDKLSPHNENLVLLDGDELRRIMMLPNDYSLAERKKASQRYSYLCQSLTLQNINVICATISLFKEIQQWNRRNIKNYIEIFIDLPIDVIKSRDKNTLYNQNNRSIVGLDLNAEKPKKPEIHITPTMNDTIKDTFFQLTQGLNHANEMGLYQCLKNL